MDLREDEGPNVGAADSLDENRDEPVPAPVPLAVFVVLINALGAKASTPMLEHVHADIIRTYRSTFRLQPNILYVV